MLLFVPVDAPLVRTLVRTYSAVDPWLRVYALKLSMPPKGPLYRITLATVCTYVSPLVCFDGASLLLLQRFTGVVLVHSFVRPQQG